MTVGWKIAVGLDGDDIARVSIVPVGPKAFAKRVHEFPDIEHAMAFVAGWAAAELAELAVYDQEQSP